MSLALIKKKGVAAATLEQLQAASAELNARIAVLQNDMAKVDADIAAEALSFAVGDTKKHDALRDQKRQTEGDLAVIQTALAQIGDQLALVELWGEQSKVLDRFAAALKHASVRAAALTEARDALLRSSQLLQDAENAEFEVKKLVDGLGGLALVPDLDYVPALQGGDVWLRRQREGVVGKDMEAKILKMRSAYCAQAGITAPVE